MLRIPKPTTSDKAALDYFDNALSRGDYHSEDGRTIGFWLGQGAAWLGLEGDVTREAFASLAQNRHPESGEPLTPRTKDGRRVGFDLTWDAPKSVTLAWLAGDERIPQLLKESAQETLQELEASVQTRVRQSGQWTNRTTGNLVAAGFLHTTTRPLDDGLPDPNLHLHTFVFNNTFDPVEKRHKAIELGNVHLDRPYYEAAFHARLANRLRGLGYALEPTARGWEIAGIDRSLIDKFSRRTATIEALAKEKGITDPKQKAQLGAKTRRKKGPELPTETLRSYWESRLSDHERFQLTSVAQKAREGAYAPQPTIKAHEAIGYAIRHLFERQSVVEERPLLAEALRYAAGSVLPQEAKESLKQAKVFTTERQGRTLVFTPEVLAQERAILDFARQGLGTRTPLGPKERSFERDWLTSSQKAAIRHIWDSCDSVTLIRGAAGAGKTTMLQEAVAGIEAQGRRVYAFAPSADASRGTLRKEGFTNAETVARLLVDEKLHEQVRGQVVLIDEAGLLGMGTTQQLFDLAQRLSFRLILVGDRKQHGAVERPGALRLLEEKAGLPLAEVTEIQRQKGEYKKAIESLSEGQTLLGLDRLEQLGWVQEIPSFERESRLAQDYVELSRPRSKRRESASVLVVAPTHAEGERITSAIRAELQRQGRLSAKEREFVRLENADWTLAQKGEPSRYRLGDVVQFHQNAPGFRRGERLSVLGHTDTSVQVQTAAGEKKSLPLQWASRYQLYHTQSLRLAEGDRLRITGNGRTKDNHRLNNGALYTVQGFTRSGDIVLENGWTIDQHYGHITQGYAVTSHASQGKTVDVVLVGLSALSYKAASQQQLYVSMSRGRHKAVLYTDDKEGLRRAVGKNDERLLASDLVGTPIPKPKKPTLKARLLEHVAHFQRWASIARDVVGSARDKVRTITRTQEEPVHGR
jgi:conjugative relaxase-like TrwC/TraI family protein